MTRYVTCFPLGKCINLLLRPRRVSGQNPIDDFVDATSDNREIPSDDAAGNRILHNETKST